MIEGLNRQEINQLLQDYIATVNNPDYGGDMDLINSKFPEFKGIDPQVLLDYVATVKNPKYRGNLNVINQKFPEFFGDVKKKENPQPVQVDSDGSGETEITEDVIQEEEGVPISSESSDQELDFSPAEVKRYNPMGSEMNRQDLLVEEKDTFLERTFGKNELTDLFGDMYRAAVAGQAQGGSVDESLELLGKSRVGAKISSEDIQDFFAAQERMQQQGESDEMKSFNQIYQANGGGVMGWLKGVWANPTVVPQLFVSSMSAMLTPATIAGGTAGAVAGAGVASAGGSIGGPVGSFLGAIGGGTTGFFLGASTTLETGLTFAELLQKEVGERGYNLDEEGIRKVLEDKNAMSSIRNKSAARGVTIGAIDAIASKVGVKVGAKTLGKKAYGVGTKVKAIGKVAGIEAAGGSLGEIGGRLAAGQEMDAAEILFEGVAGTATLPLTLGLAAYKKPKYYINKSQYDENGKELARVDQDQMMDAVYNSTDAEFQKMELTAVNNPQLDAAIKERKNKIHSRQAAQREIVQAKPDIKKSQLDKLTPLQEELNKLDGNKSQVAKKRRAEIIAEMNAIEDGVATEKTEVEVTREEAKKALEADNDLALEMKQRGMPGPELQILSEENIENKRQKMLQEKIAAQEQMSENQKKSTETTETTEKKASKEVQEEASELAEAVDLDEGKPVETTETTETTETEVVDETVQPEVTEEQAITELKKEGVDNPTPQQIKEKQNALQESSTTQVDGQKQTESVSEISERNTGPEQPTQKSKEKTKSKDTTKDTKKKKKVESRKSKEDKIVKQSTKKNNPQKNVYINKKGKTKIEKSKLDSVVDKAKKAFKAISKLSPKTKIFLHTDQNEYNNITGKPGTAGLFSADTNAIHINVSNMKSYTIAHEVFHAILYEKFGTDVRIEAAMGRFIQALLNSDIDNATKRKLENFVKLYDKGVKNEEYVSELFGMLAEEYTTLSVKAKSLVQKLMMKLAELLGLKYAAVGFSTLKTDTAIIDLLNNLSRAVREGEVVEGSTFGDEVTFKEFDNIFDDTIEMGKTVENPANALKEMKIGGFEVSYTQQDSIAEMIKKGLVTEPKNVKFLEGLLTVITSPDDMLAGEIKFNGKVIFEGEGGVFFVTKFGDVWASGKKGTANSIARALNEQLKANGGRAFLTLTKGTDSKLVSSASGVNSTLAILNTMLDKKLISASNFRTAVSSAVKKAGGSINLRQSARDLKTDIQKYFTDPNTTTFEKRGFVVKDIVGEIAKNLPKEDQAAIAEFLGGDKSRSVGKGKTELVSGKPGSQALVELVAQVAAERLTKGLKTGDVYAVIEVNGPVEVKKDTHPSYPFHISLKDGSKPILHLPQTRESGTKVLVQKSGVDYKVRNVSVVEGSYKGEKGDKSQKIRSPKEIGNNFGMNKKGFIPAKNVSDPYFIRQALKGTGITVKENFVKVPGDVPRFVSYSFQIDGRFYNPMSSDKSQKSRIFNTSDTINDVVAKARARDYSDAAIYEYLRNNRKLTVDEARAAIENKDGAYAGMPSEFTNVEGGINEGQTLYNEITYELKKFIRENPKATPIAIGKKAFEILRKNEIFLKQFKTIKTQLEVAYAGVVSRVQGSQVKYRIARLKRDLYVKNQGARDLRKIQLQLNQLIRKYAPKEATYTKNELNKLISQIAKASDKTILDVSEKVFDLIDRKRNQVKQSLIKEIKALIKKQAQGTPSKQRATNLEAQGKQFFKDIVDIIQIVTRPDTVKEGDILSPRGRGLRQLQQEMTANEELTQIALEKQRRGEKLTVAEVKLINRALAFDTFANIQNLELEAVEGILKQLKDTKSASIALLNMSRLERAEVNNSIYTAATEEIRENYPQLFDEVEFFPNGDPNPNFGKVKDANQLNQEENRGVLKKLREKVLDFFRDFDFVSPLGITKFFRNRLSHLGTLTNLMDNVAKGNTFFYENVYQALNRMHTKALRGYYKQIEVLNSIAATIDGIESYQDLKNKFDKFGLIDVTKSNGVTDSYSLNQMMRIYALSQNQTQREKLEQQGIGKEQIDFITDQMGEQAVEFVDKIVDYLSLDYFESVNDVYKEANYVNLDQIPNYFPTKSISSTTMVTDLLQGNFMKVFNDVTAPATKNRTDEIGAVDLNFSFTESLENHITQMERFKAYAMGVKNLQAIFKVPAVNSLLDRLNIRDVLYQSINLAINPTANAMPSGAMAKLMTRFTGYALSFKIVQLVKQSTSFVNAFEDYPGVKGSKVPKMVSFMVGMAKVIARLPYYMQLAQTISPDFKDRWRKGLEGDIYRLESGSRTLKPVEKRTAGKGFEARWNRSWKFFKQAAAMPTVLGDVMGVMGYMVNYVQNLENGMSKAEAAEQFADYNATQQSRRGTDKIPLQQSQEPLARAFTMFGSTIFLQINKVLQTTTNIMRSIKEKGSVRNVRAKDIKGLALNYAGANVMFAIAANLALLMKGNDDDQEKAMDRIKDAMYGLNLLYMIPFIGGASEEAINKLKGRKGYGDDVVNPYKSIFRKVSRATTSGEGIQPLVEILMGAQIDPFVGVYNAIAKDGDKQEEAIYDILGVSSSYQPALGMSFSAEDMKYIKETNPELYKTIQKQKRLNSGQGQTKAEMKRDNPSLYYSLYPEADE